MTSESHAEDAPPPLLGVLLFMLVAVVVLGMALLSRFNGFKVYDDAYIFVRYADHLIAGKGMVWNIGQGTVYGATSLGFVFGLIPFRLLFPSNPTAAAFTASFFWGVVFLALLFRLALKVMQPTTNQKIYLMGFLMLALIATAVSLRGHFASGMETTLVMSYLTLVIAQLERLRQNRGNVWFAGAVLGVAWWMRPDLLIFTIGIPAIMLLLQRKQENRGLWLRVLLLSLAGVCLCLLGAHLVTGAWLPLSFYAKSTGLYGPSFAAHYRFTPLAEGGRFIARSWPMILVIGMGFYVKWGRLREGYNEFDKAMLVTVLIFAGYFSLFVLQVMGFGQRFYYPIFPFLAYLALRELMELQENLRLGQGMVFKRIPIILERVGLLVIAAFMLYFGIDFGRGLKISKPQERFAVFDAGRVYREDLQDYWPRLEAMRGMPAELRIATTEVGLPAALYPDHVIDDIAGLNNPALVREGLTAAALLQHCPADLIYLPHEHYEAFANSIAASVPFQQQYLSISAADLQAALGVAIRRDSPYFERLLQLFSR